MKQSRARKLIRKFAIGATSIVLAILCLQLGFTSTDNGNECAESSWRVNPTVTYIAHADGEDGNPFFGRGDEDLLKKAVGAKTGTLAAGSDSPIVFIKKIISTISYWLLSLLGTISVLALVYAGFLWVTARGVPDQLTKAKQIVGYAIAGLLLAFFSYAIVTAITKLPGEVGAPGGGSKSGAEQSDQSKDSSSGPEKLTGDSSGGPENTSKDSSGGPEKLTGDSSGGPEQSAKNDASAR